MPKFSTMRPRIRRLIYSIATRLCVIIHLPHQLDSVVLPFVESNTHRSKRVNSPLFGIHRLYTSTARLIDWMHRMCKLSTVSFTWLLADSCLLPRFKEFVFHQMHDWSIQSANHPTAWLFDCLICRLRDSVITWFVNHTICRLYNSVLFSLAEPWWHWLCSIWCYFRKVISCSNAHH